MSRAYCDREHPGGDVEADQWCRDYHRPTLPQAAPCHPTGRRLYVLDDCDARVLAWAADHDGLLPDWTEPYTLDALVLENYATPATPTEPARLTPAGHARWQRVIDSDRAFRAVERTWSTSG